MIRTARFSGRTVKSRTSFDAVSSLTTWGKTTAAMVHLRYERQTMDRGKLAQRPVCQMIVVKADPKDLTLGSLSYVLFTGSTR